MVSRKIVVDYAFARQADITPSRVELTTLFSTVARDDTVLSAPGATTGASGSTPPGPTPAKSEGSSTEGFPIGAIIGIVAGGVVCLILVAVAVFFLYRKKNEDMFESDDEAAAEKQRRKEEKAAAKEQAKVDKAKAKIVAL